MFDCLEFCKLASLPEVEDGKSVWINAIAKTKKLDGNYYYCYVERDRDGKPSVVRDFGAVSAIIEYVEYYPIIYLNPAYLFKAKKDEEGNQRLVEYLKKEGVNLEWETADRKTLDKENIKVAIRRQLAEEKKKSKIIVKY